jgi:amino acid adenylation domain-containing protein
MEKIIHLSEQGKLPLSSNQMRLWIIYQQDKLDPTYNLQIAFHLNGAVDIEILRKSMDVLFKRQHALFSVFKQSNGIPYISIIPRPVIVELIDFSDQSPESARENTLSFAGDQSRVPFDIENGPLFRIFLLKESDQSYFFCAIVHHIIFDGFSRRLFVEELNRIYSDLKSGLDDPIEPLKFHSYDFAVLEKEELSPVKEEEIINYWKENLKDCPPELKFPYDFPRSKHPTGLGIRERFQISKEYSQKLRSFVKDSDTSVFNALLSVMGILFQKSTGVNDICIGIPVSNRRSASSFKILGFFVNTIPIRFLIDEGKTFGEYLVHSTDVFKKAVQNLLPFDKIVKALQPERIQGLNPFFQISFSWINNFTIPMDLGGIHGERLTVPKSVSSFDITFYMWESGDVIEGEIEYNIDLFSNETILRLRDNFLTLVKNLVDNPQASIGSLPIISEEERKMIDGFNETQTVYPKDKTIVQLFEEQVELFPDNEAVVYNDISLTYRDLNEKTNQLSRALRNSGIGANDPVCILLERSADMIVGIFGILKAGGAYVPIDPDYPRQRKDFIIKDSGCKVLITQDKFIKETDDGIVKLSIDSTDFNNFEKSNIDGINGPTDLAYIIYTSGTTGIPKGSLIPHRGVVRLVKHSCYVEFAPEDKVLLVAAIVFDASTEEIFGALLNGSTLYVADKTTILDPNELGELLEEKNITLTDIGAGLFMLIAESHPEIFNKLKILILGGDVLSAPHVNKVRKMNPNLIVINAYGPTENSCNSTAYKIEKDFESNIPIGKPICNSTAYIFDKFMNYQPIGIIGELYVGGDGLSKGYLNRDDLNKKSFVDHPYFPGNRLYKTGDLARWLPDGNIEFFGRIDNQLKIRGFRIELEEIESVLSGVGGIKEAIVKPINFAQNDVRLVAFLNVEKDFNIDFKLVDVLLRSKLPLYMVPSVYKTVDSFPITINGKIDRKAIMIDLSEFNVDEKEIDKEELSFTQMKILKIWQDLIKTKSIGIDENFFDAGGSSFLAMQVVDRIEKEFHINLSLRLFFESPVIRSLAELTDLRINSVKTNVGNIRKIKSKDDNHMIKGVL